MDRQTEKSTIRQTDKQTIDKQTIVLKSDNSIEIRQTDRKKTNRQKFCNKTR